MTPCPKDSLGRSQCAEFIRTQLNEIAAKHGGTCESVVSTAPPIVDTGYEQYAYECPHGTVYWVEPTSEQMARWAADKTP